MVPILMMMHTLASKRRIARQQSEIKSSKMDCCRTCLSTDNLSDIFTSKETIIKRTQDLKLTTGLKINYQDGLSQKICKMCSDIIRMALKFRRKSHKAEKTLLNMKHKDIKTEKICDNVIEKKDHMATNDYSYNYYDDDFHNQDYDDEKPKEVKQKILLKKKRAKVPIATSYKCNTCNKEFRMKATYRAHMRFHTNFCVCEACGKRCRNNNQLQEHKRARHGLGKIHKCAYCEYSSATKEALIIHERRHTGERPYICDHCGASFYRRSTLVQHIAIHLPEKNFQCDMCPKRLKSKKFLQIHKHNAHTGKRYGYLCPICEHRFEKPNKVRAHTRRVHGVPDEQHGAIVRIQL
ncbi:zinc finger protein 551-like [Pieris brassicae]|uniref:Uncharacterized protein n=1 Tax=Pieris brassicae TaxID=7116 RepID=A0A9P0TSL3_PIEBR|nr:zinc finger protein 551-like [Pieris brassicae]CAH4034338.1 unnamed protein product [Pieris brassicae]